MTLLDDLKNATLSALSAGASAARTQGTALKNDFENLMKPNLDAIMIDVAAITQAHIDRTIGDDQARDDLKTQFDKVQSLVLATAELLLEAVQNIINAVLKALTAAINAAVGIALL
jgi:hypothetical protein